MVFYMCFYWFYGQSAFSHERFGNYEICWSDMFLYNERIRYDKKLSIILCGFTSSGKTTIGKLLSERLGLPFYDTDQMLIEHYQMTIPESLPKAAKHFSAIWTRDRPPGMHTWSIRRLHRRRHADLWPEWRDSRQKRNDLLHWPPIWGLLFQSCTASGAAVV